MHKNLFVSRPVEVKGDVLEKMSMPLIGHRTEEISELQERISRKLQKILNTNEEILLSTSSGSGLMEGAIRSCTAKRAAFFSSGAFGNRWYEIAKANNIAADLYEVQWGGAVNPELVDEVLSSGKYDLIAITHNETSTGIMNPVEEIAKVVKKYPEIIWCLDAVSSIGGSEVQVDRLGIDICITSTQKALGVPPGMSICSFSEKAIERAEKIPYRGYYLDLLKLCKCVSKKNHQYPFTPSISHMFALDYQLDKILREGLENRYDRHKEMANYVRTWCKEYFELFADERYLSNTVTVVKNTRHVNVGELNSYLGERGYSISNGYGKLEEKSFRIAHMGDKDLEEVKALIDNINDILQL